MMQFPKKCKFLHNLIMLHGGNIRIVGGYVRDLLLCKTNIDIDLVTDLPPEIIIEICKEHKLSFMTLGIDYGTITVIINNEKFEITSLRKDIKCYGRVAEVSFTKNWEEDAMRRDFTINGLYLDIDNNIYDYYSGISDLNNNKVRFIGDPITRIKEDYLRIMRYFRFLNIFDTVNIHDASLEAAITLSFNLNLISKERLKDELFKILSSSNPQISLQYIINYKILHNTELNFISNITSING